MKRLLIILLSIICTQCSINDSAQSSENDYLSEIARWNERYKEDSNVHYGIGQSSDPIARHILAFGDAFYQWYVDRSGAARTDSIIFNNHFGLDVLDIFVEDTTECVAIKFKEGDDYDFIVEGSSGTIRDSMIYDTRIFIVIRKNGVSSGNSEKMEYYSYYNINKDLKSNKVNEAKSFEIEYESNCQFLDDSELTIDDNNQSDWVVIK